MIVHLGAVKLDRYEWLSEYRCVRWWCLTCVSHLDPTYLCRKFKRGHVCTIQYDICMYLFLQHLCYCAHVWVSTDSNFACLLQYVDVTWPWHLGVFCTLCVSVCAPYARSGGTWTLCLQCRPLQHMHHELLHHDLLAETHAANLGQSALLLEVQLNRNSNHFQSCQHVWFAHLLLCNCIPSFKLILKLD